MELTGYSYTPLAVNASRQITSDVRVARLATGHAVTAGTVTRTLASWQAALGLAHLWQTAIAADGLAAFTAEMDPRPVTLARKHSRTRVIRAASLAAGNVKPAGPMYFRTTDDLLTGKAGRVHAF